MRNVGDGAGRGGQLSGGHSRRRRSDDDGSEFYTPAYRQRSGQAEYGASATNPAPYYDDLDSGYSWSADDPDAWPAMSLSGRDAVGQPARSNAVRGFPPAPGDPLPVYPPGPFAAWNVGQPGRSDGRSGQSGRAGLTDASALTTATITPDEFDTDYSLPAIKDPIPGRDRRSAGSDQRQATDVTGLPMAQKARSDQRLREPAPVSHGGRSRGKASRAGDGSRKKRQPAWLAISVAGVIIAAVAAILVVTLPHGGSPAPRNTPTSTPSPVSASPTAPPGPWGFIGSRKTDPLPLTAAELFPASVSNGGTVYSRAIKAKGTNCRGALIGSALQAAVRRAGCKQTLRATYLSKGAKVMATIGVFNLKTFGTASKAAGKAGHNEFVAQLAAKAGPAKSIGQGTGLEEAIVKGHYLVLVWAENTNLNAPKTQAGRTRLTDFMNLLVKHTVNVSLSNRMVDGKPVAS
ncbi:MAG TPA: hypothetical protein VJT16_19725 [Streptosporangiaceae bacterium]|nr:hypothetical protein [Streptosporangiaceae bacterium]